MNKNGTTTTDQGASAIEGRIEGIKESVKGFVDKGKGLVDKGEKRVDEIKTRVIEVKDEAVTRGNKLLDQAVSFVRANPMKAVGIAFGAGYFGMRLFRR